MRNVLSRHIALVAAAVSVWSAAGGFAGIPGVAAQAVGGYGHHHPAGHPRWLSWNMKSHTATLRLMAGYTGAFNGFNFDGHGKGSMVIVMPMGFHVHVLFTNKGSYPHSAVITPYADRVSASTHPLALPHASVPDPTMGVGAGKSASFWFPAQRAGRYALVCGVHGHAGLGMWDVFKVVRGGKPHIVFRKPV